MKYQLVDTAYAAETSHETTAATEESGGIAAGAQALGINGPALAAQILNFFILLFLLQRFLYRPLVGLLEKRRHQIETSLQQAEEMERRHAEFQVEHEARLTESKAEAAAIIEKATQAANQLRQETLATATAEADKLLVRTHEEIARQKEQLLQDLKQEVGSLVVAATAKVLGKNIDTDAQQQLVKEALAEVKK